MHLKTKKTLVKQWFAFGVIFFASGPYYEGNICVFLSRAKRFALQTNILILRPKTLYFIWLFLSFEKKKNGLLSVTFSLRLRSEIFGLKLIFHLHF